MYQLNEVLLPRKNEKFMHMVGCRTVIMSMCFADMGEVVDRTAGWGSSCGGHSCSCGPVGI